MGEQFVSDAFEQYENYFIYLFAFGLVLAIVSHFATEQILHSFLYNKDKELRWRSTIFFIVDLLLIMLLGYQDVLDKHISFPAMLFEAIIISGVSLAVYTVLPAMLKKFTGYNFVTDNEKRIRRKNGNEKKTPD